MVFGASIFAEAARGSTFLMIGLLTLARHYEASMFHELELLAMIDGHASSPVAALTFKLSLDPVFLFAASIK